MRIMLFYFYYGLGHLKVAEALKEEFEKKGYCVKIINPIDVSHPVIGFLWKKISRLSVKYFPKNKFYEKYLKNNDPYHLSKKLKFLYNIFCYLYTNNRVIRKIKKFNPDVIITCSTASNILATYIKNKKLNTFRLANVFTDYTIHTGNLLNNTSVDYFFVPNDKIKKELTKYNIDNEKIIVSGIPISSRFNPKLYKENVIRKKLKIDKNIPIILFLCGGGMGIDTGFCWFKELTRRVKDYQYIFVSGKNTLLYIQAKEFVRENKVKCLVLPFVNNMPELLAIASLVITKPGGITVTECIAMKKRMIFVNPLPGQEERNAEYVESMGLGKLATTFEQLEKLISTKEKQKYECKTFNSIDVIEKTLKQNK